MKTDFVQEKVEKEIVAKRNKKIKNNKYIILKNAVLSRDEIKTVTKTFNVYSTTCALVVTTKSNNETSIAYTSDQMINRLPDIEFEQIINEIT